MQVELTSAVHMMKVNSLLQPQPTDSPDESPPLDAGSYTAASKS